LTDFLTKLESWRSDSEPADDFFHQKSVLYQGLIELIPVSEPERLKVINSYVEFLGQNYFQRKSRSEWFLHVADLLSRFSPATHNQETMEIVHAFLTSSDPTLNLYGRVAQWEPSATVQKSP
jgi:hypothetical protein